MKLDVFEHINYELRGDGFLTVTFDDCLKEVRITKELIRKMIDKALVMLEGKACPFLFLYGELDVKVDFDAILLITKDPGLLTVKKAEAIVTTSLANRLVVNMYTSFFGATTPVRVFKTEEEARKWLNQFL